MNEKIPGKPEMLSPAEEVYTFERRFISIGLNS
jgi:hypothetical protein